MSAAAKPVRRTVAAAASAIQLPLVHINGTSAKALVESYELAGQALARAIECLQDAAPNGRDYYALGPDAWKRATQEHTARVDKLRAVYVDLQALYEHCSA